jgi:hypothetical protein
MIGYTEGQTENEEQENLEDFRDRVFKKKD